MNASIGGTTADGQTQLTVGYIENISGLVDPNDVSFITAGRPELDEISSVGVKVDFENITEIANSVDSNELYVVSPDRDALIVVNSADLSVKQVLEGIRDDGSGRCP